MPAKVVRSFGRWLVKDWQDFRLATKPEVFPAQDSIEGEHGNAVRLPGLHHTYQHYSRVWDGKGWASGEKAVEMIVATTGDPINLIPDEAKEYQPPKSDNTRRVVEKVRWRSPHPGCRWTFQVEGHDRSRGR